MAMVIRSKSVYGDCSKFLVESYEPACENIEYIKNVQCSLQGAQMLSATRPFAQDHCAVESQLSHTCSNIPNLRSCIYIYRLSLLPLETLLWLCVCMIAQLHSH